ncbi:MAG: hypothetical protein H6710_07090 [Myxococcales bacterium]|nr:hypothetical protein [Myxococcales bacterium]
MAGASGTRRAARLAGLGLALSLSLALVGGQAEARPAIPPGREAAIVELLAPYRLGAEIVDGWTLRSINTEVSTIHVWVEGPEGALAHLTLDHPGYAPARARRSAGFAIAQAEAPPGSERALAELEAAVVAADDGSFWGTSGSAATLEVDDDRGRGRFASGARGWAGDGLLLLAGLVALLIAAVARGLRGLGGRVALGLALVTLIGAGLRVALAPVVGLTAWPYTRVPWLAERIFEGPLLALAHPGPVWLSDVITSSTLALAILGPLAIFAHARHLLGEGRAALIAAALLAILPQHIRFAQSDVVFVASMTISSLAFASVHAAAREAGRWRWVALAAITPLLALTYVMRPLNILYGGLMLGALWLDQGIAGERAPAPPRRRLVVVGVILLTTLVVGLPGLLGEYPEQVRGGLSLGTLVDGLAVLVSPRDDVLLNPTITPPLLTLLALFGGWELWRRGRRRLLAFLVGWLLAFLFGHAYVIPREPLMQARYHLHLVVPFLYLAAAGLVGLGDRLRGRRWRTPALALVGGALAISPLLHRAFIGDVDLNETDEWRWVHGLREAIPAGCAIVEFTGEAAESRFARVGAYAEEGAAGSRWTIVSAASPGPGEPTLDRSVDAFLAAPPACLYYYEGLPCFAYKPVDAEVAGACAAIRERLEGRDLEEVDRLERRSRSYDENLAGGLEAGDRIVLRLLRTRSP